MGRRRRRAAASKHSAMLANPMKLGRWPPIAATLQPLALELAEVCCGAAPPAAVLENVAEPVAGRPAALTLVPVPALGWNAAAGMVTAFTACGPFGKSVPAPDAPPLPAAVVANTPHESIGSTVRATVQLGNVPVLACGTVTSWSHAAEGSKLPSASVQGVTSMCSRSSMFLT
jgi:hypothetical protein